MYIVLFSSNAMKRKEENILILIPRGLGNIQQTANFFFYICMYLYFLIFLHSCQWGQSTPGKVSPMIHFFPTSSNHFHFSAIIYGIIYNLFNVYFSTNSLLSFFFSVNASVNLTSWIVHIMKNAHWYVDKQEESPSL